MEEGGPGGGRRLFADRWLDQSYFRNTEMSANETLSWGIVNAHLAPLGIKIPKTDP